MAIEQPASGDTGGDEKPQYGPSPLAAILRFLIDGELFIHVVRHPDGIVATEIIDPAWVVINPHEEQSLAYWRERALHAERRGRELTARVAHLDAEIEAARQEAFRYGFKLDCDESDPDEVAQADNIISLMSWIAQAECDARSERDSAYTRLRELEGKAGEQSADEIITQSGQVNMLRGRVLNLNLPQSKAAEPTES